MEKRGDKECASIFKESLQTDALPERAKLPQQDLLLQRGSVASRRVARVAAVQRQLRPFPMLHEHQFCEAIGMRVRQGHFDTVDISRERRVLVVVHLVELDRY